WSRLQVLTGEIYCTDGADFKSTQDTIVALEALSEYALNSPQPPITEVDVQFTTPGKSDVQKLSLDNKGEKVETELKVYPLQHTH
uniref:Alpha-macroglobulin-like TED domain-containing protein n=1 Tax=Hucho hucho TaxID=62062 RepID=A0A4W5PY10_9TELE